jgi:hypothetical protein
VISLVGKYQSATTYWELVITALTTINYDSLTTTLYAGDTTTPSTNNPLMYLTGPYNDTTGITLVSSVLYDPSTPTLSGTGTITLALSPNATSAITFYGLVYYNTYEYTLSVE